MPNHCENDLYITGPKDEVLRFIEAPIHNKYKLDFNDYIPYPQKFKDLDASYASRQAEYLKFIGPKQPGTGISYPKNGYNSGGYEWCCRNWGTKWNAYNQTTPMISKSAKNVSRKYATVMFSFETAWSPPIPVVLAMAKKHPNLTFDMRSYERGAGYKTRFRVKGEEVLEDSHGKYSGPRGG